MEPIHQSDPDRGHLFLEILEIDRQSKSAASGENLEARNVSQGLAAPLIKGRRTVPQQTQAPHFVALSMPVRKRHVSTKAITRSERSGANEDTRD